MARRLVIAVLAACLLPGAAAEAAKDRPPGKDRVRAVYRDCASSRTGKLRHRFKMTTLRRARRHMPRDLRDYSDCQTTIDREIRRRRQLYAKTK